MDSSTVIIIIFGVFVVLLAALSIWGKSYQKKKDECMSVHFLGMGDSSAYMIIKKRSKNIPLIYEEGHDYAFSEVPDKVMFTSVTVGGVTTGGASVVKGGLQPHDLGKNGKWYLKGPDGKGGFVRLRAVILTEEDFSVAKENTVLKGYIDEIRKANDTDALSIPEDLRKRAISSWDMSLAAVDYLENWLKNRK